MTCTECSERRTRNAELGYPWRTEHSTPSFWYRQLYLMARKVTTSSSARRPQYLALSVPATPRGGCSFRPRQEEQRTLLQLVWAHFILGLLWAVFSIKTMLHFSRAWASQMRRPGLRHYVPRLLSWLLRFHFQSFDHLVAYKLFNPVTCCGCATSWSKSLYKCLFKCTSFYSYLSNNLSNNRRTTITPNKRLALRNLIRGWYPVLLNTQ